MKLYEVNAGIQAVVDQLVDPETGELVGDADTLMEQLETLQLERQRILEYLAKVVLNTRAEGEALRAEETRLKQRRERLAKQEEHLLTILDRECKGEKTNLGVATISYRKTARIVIDDAARAVRWLKRNKHHDCYRVREPEVAKSEVKKLIRAGTQIPGCSLVEDTSCSLR